MRATWNTFISHFEVRLEVSGTSVETVEHWIRNIDTARSPAGTQSIHMTQRVGVTTDVSIVLQDTSSELHASVVSFVQQYDLMLPGTRRHERLRFAALFVNNCNNAPYFHTFITSEFFY